MAERTPRDFRAEADQIEAEAEIEAERIREVAAIRAEGLRQTADRLDRLEKAPKEKPLSSGLEYETNEEMESNEIATPRRRRGVPLKSDGPIARVAKSLGLSMTGIAALIRENSHSVRTWDARGKVPEDVQAKIDGLVADRKRALKKAK